MLYFVTCSLNYKYGFIYNFTCKMDPSQCYTCPWPALTRNTIFAYYYFKVEQRQNKVTTLYYL